MDRFRSRTSRICYFSLGNGDYVHMLKNLLTTFYRFNYEPFVTFSDQRMSMGTTMPLKSSWIEDLKVRPKRFFVKFLALGELIKNTDYDYYVFIDADCMCFKRININHLLGYPFVCLLESDIENRQGAIKNEWHALPWDTIIGAINSLGVKYRPLRHLNGGFFIIRRNDYNRVVDLIYKFWKVLDTTEEPCMVYAMYNIYDRLMTNFLLDNNRGLYCGGIVPDDVHLLLSGKFRSKIWLTGKYIDVSPAIVHAWNAKEELIKLGKHG